MEDPERNALFQGAVLSAAEEAAIQAVRTLQPARLLVGTAPCGINTNRDVETPSGWWIGTDPSGPSNHLLTLIRAKALDGSPIGALVSYGIKPCTLDLAGMAQKTRLVSSDVAGFACAKVQEVWSSPVLFLMSAAADQVPVKQAYRETVEPDGTVRSMDKGVEKGLSYVAELGQEMSNAIFRAAESASPLAVSSLDQEAGTLHWGTRGREKLHPRKELSYVQDGDISLPIQVLRIGDLALVGEKPEVCAVTEETLLAASPYPHTILLCMVNGGFKYMPDKNSYDRITWEAQSAGLLPGAAEAFVRLAQQLLCRMQTRQGVDWSCRHDILLKNQDGTFSPMDLPYFRSRLVAPGTWQILRAGDYSYLIERDQEAFAFDTGYGAGNIRAYLQTLTEKPVRAVINSHSHFDHTAGNGYFDEAFMAFRAIPPAAIPFHSFEGIPFRADYKRTGIREGDVLDPGGRPWRSSTSRTTRTMESRFWTKRRGSCFPGMSSW